MNEQEVRALVREAIEKHLGRPDSAANRLRQGYGESSEAPTRRDGEPSHIILNVQPGSEIDAGMCLIEPAVRCNHCGFCQSYGH